MKTVKSALEIVLESMREELNELRSSLEYATDHNRTHLQVFYAQKITSLEIELKQLQQHEGQ